MGNKSSFFIGLLLRLVEMCSSCTSVNGSSFLLLLVTLARDFVLVAWSEGMGAPASRSFPTACEGTQDRWGMGPGRMLGDFYS